MSRSGHSELSQDVVFDLLSSPRRRFVLYYLREADGPVELRELADEVAAWENETAVEDLTSQQRKRVYVSLYQTHIPKLEEAGIIDYDSEESIVQFADRTDSLGRYLVRDGEQIRWGRYYLALAFVSAAFLLGVAFDVSVFGAVPALVATAVIVGAFVALTLAHRIYLRRTKRRALRGLVDVED